MGCPPGVCRGRPVLCMRKEKKVNTIAGRIKRTIGVVLAVTAICLSACGRTGWINSAEGERDMYGNDGETKSSEGINITSRQRQILRASGLSHSEIDEIGEKGWTPAMKSYVDVAERVLNELKKKYGIEFMIYGGAVPDLFTDNFTFFAYALEGESAGVRFEVTYGADAEGKPEIKEGYFAESKSPEMEKYFQDITAEVDAGVRVLASVTGMVGAEFGRDNVLEDMKGMEAGFKVWLIVFAPPDMEEERFMSLNEELEAKYRETGYYIDFVAFRILDKEKFNEVYTYRDFDRLYPRGVREVGSYDIEYKEKVESENIIYDIRYDVSIYPAEEE